MKVRIFKSKKNKLYLKTIDKEQKTTIVELNLSIMDLEIDLHNKVILFIPKNGKKYIEQIDDYEKYNTENYIV